MLSRAQHDEVGLDIEYLPDLDAMLKYGDKAVLVTARYKGILVGYIFYLIGPYKHNTELLYAQIEAVYLIPSFRSGRTAIKMFRLGEEAVKKQLARFVLISSTIKKDISKLLNYLDYKPVETVYKKDISYEQQQTSFGSTKPGQF